MKVNIFARVYQGGFNMSYEMKLRIKEGSSNGLEFYLYEDEKLIACIGNIERLANTVKELIIERLGE